VARPDTGDRRPKNAKDQRTETTSCPANNIVPNRAGLFRIPSLTTRYRDIPIRIYNVVHTGPNTQGSGVSGGLIKPVYQVGIEDRVGKEPATPANKGNTIQIISRPGDRSECMFIGVPGIFLASGL